MNKVLITATTALTMAAMSAVAHAGDIGLAPSSYDWSGGYVGVNAGAAINTSEFNSSYKYTGTDVFPPGDTTPDIIDAMGTSVDSSQTVFTGGINAGYNWQISNVVLGLEGDFNYLDFSTKTHRNISGDIDQVFTDPSTSATDTFRLEGDWYGTVRGRLGYSVNSLLFYGTGGLAYGKLSAKESVNASNDGEYATWSGSNEGWRLGWTVGAGVEYGVDRWVLGAEYLYVDLGSAEWTSPSNVFTATDSVNDAWADVEQKGSVDYRFGVARATLKYRF